jgi:diacylglycerol kinase
MTGDKKSSLFESIILATSSILRVIRMERNIKIHLGILSVVVVGGIFLGISRIEWLIIILISSAVLAAETFNAAIEQTCDYIDEQHDLKFGETKIARDMAAGAVWLLAIASIIVGLLIFLPYLISFS